MQLFCFATLLAIPGAPVAIAQGVRVEGVVRDTTGAVVSGTRVELHAKSYSAESATSAQGTFAFEHVPERSGTIAVVAAGFQQAAQPWSAPSDNSAPAHLEFVLAISSVSQHMIVTAARTATHLSDSPIGVTRISSGDLTANPGLTLDEALEQVPGFSLFRRSSSRTANPTTQGVSLRGLGASGASRALVMEDGIPLNDPFGGWVHWDLVPAQSVESIEVDQEGASSLYGSDALGGVVQFLTRPAQSSGVSLETSYGNQNTPDASLWAGGQTGRWESVFGGELLHTDGYVLVPKSNRGAVDTDAGSEHATADLMVGRKIGEQSEIFARGWYLGELRNNGTPLQTNDTHLAQGALGANLRLGGAALTLRFYGVAETYHQNFSSIALNRNSEILTDMQTVPAQGAGGSAVWSRPAGKHQTLVAGFDAHEEIGHSNEAVFASGKPSRDTSAGGRQRTVGFFGEDLIQITPKWLVTLSGRFDYWRNFEASSFAQPVSPPGLPANTLFADRTYNVFDPRLNVAYQMNSNVSWSASIYRAFRAPSLNELYRPFRLGNVLTEANANLIAERLTGGEAGVAVNSFHQRLEARGSFFFNEMIDPVANVTLSSTPALITRQRQNLGRTSAPGFEVDAVAHLTGRIQLSGGYQYVDATVTRFPANTTLVGLWIPQVPHHVLTFEASYTNPARIEFSIAGRMASQQFDDDQNQFPLGRFFVLDAMASRAMGHGIELFAAAQNLLNDQYSIAATPVTQIGLPITARAGLRFQFSPRK